MALLNTSIALKKHKNENLEICVNLTKDIRVKNKLKILTCTEFRLRGGFWNPQPQFSPFNMPAIMGSQTNAPMIFMPSIPTPSPVYVCSPMINPCGTSPTIILSLPNPPTVHPITTPQVSPTVVTTRLRPTPAAIPTQIHRHSMEPPENQVRLSLPPQKISVPSERVQYTLPLPPKSASVLRDATIPLVRHGIETESLAPSLTVAPLAPGSTVQEMEESSVLSVEPTYLSLNAASLSDMNRTHVTPERTIVRNISNTIERNDVNKIDLKRKEQLEDEKVKRIAAEVQERRRLALEKILDDVLKGEEMPVKYKLNSALY